MAYIYLDESGDLGMGCKGSRYFIITAVKIPDDSTNNAFKRIPKRIRQSETGKKIKKTPELKFSNSSGLLRKKYLAKVLMLNVEIYSLALDKNCAPMNLSKNLPLIYARMTQHLLASANAEPHTTIILDKCMQAKQRTAFENYLKEGLRCFSISHESSMLNKGLQVTDFICGAFGEKYNRRRPHYAELLRDKILLDKITNPA